MMGQKANDHRKAEPEPDSVGIQRQGAKPPRRNRIFLSRNQKTKNHQKEFMVSWLPDGIVFGCAFAPLRLCVKTLLPVGRLQRLAGRKDRGKRPTANARPGRIQSEFNAKAQSRQDATGFNRR
jgi:hypothetical protein